jgi:hypothetical protein
MGPWGPRDADLVIREDSPTAGDLPELLVEASETVRESMELNPIDRLTTGARNKARVI